MTGALSPVGQVGRLNAFEFEWNLDVVEQRRDQYPPSGTLGGLIADPVRLDGCRGS